MDPAGRDVVLDAQRAIAGRLRARQAEIEEAVFSRVDAVFDSTGSDDPAYVAGLRPAVSAAVEYGLAEPEWTLQPPSAVLAQVRRAAELGVGLEMVLRRLVAGHGSLIEFIMEEAYRDGDQVDHRIPRHMRKAQEVLLARLTDAAAIEHRRALSLVVDSPEHRRANLVRGLLNGQHTDCRGLGYELDGVWHLGMIATGVGVREALSKLQMQLAPGTTYHYRLVGTSSVGTSYGNEESFTTPGPSEAVTKSASPIHATEATLNGSVNPNGYEAEYYYEYGLTTSYEHTTPVRRTTTSVAEAPEVITGLAADTTYHFRLVTSSVGIPSAGRDGEDHVLRTTKASFTGEPFADLVLCDNNDEYAVAVSTGAALGGPGTNVWSDWGCSSHAVVGDFTGDGKDDIAVPNEANSTWAVGVSNGTSFDAPGTGTWLTGWTATPTWAAAGDFTGNGKDDLVLCDNNEYTVAVSSGSAFGAAGTGVWLHAPCKRDAVVGDFNGDGKDDIAIPNESNNSWTVELSDGTKFGTAASGTWLAGWTATPTWADAGEGSRSEWSHSEPDAWATEVTPDATGAANNRLTAVSCTSSTFCFATAYEVYDGTDYAYGESWNGGAWTIQSFEPDSGIQLTTSPG
jgi:hypothetical protein